MNRTNIIIAVSVIGVGIIAYIIYMQAVKKKKLIADTEKIYQQSLIPTAPAPTGMPAPTPEQINAAMQTNFPYLAETPAMGGVLLPDNSGLGFMPGTTLTNLN